MAYLEVKSASKSFGKKKVLAGLSLEVESGECVVVFGPSGCGKTTLLRLIAGVLEPDQGEVWIDGKSVMSVAPEARGVAMAFQNFALYPHMDAFENIASPLRARKLPEEEVKQRVHQIAGLLRIDHVLDHLPRQLSNGQKQRTSLARSLVHGPSVLMLDDPLRNVDAKIRYEMRLELPRVFRKFHSTVLYVTQDYPRISGWHPSSAIRPSTCSLSGRSAAATGWSTPGSAASGWRWGREAPTWPGASASWGCGPRT